MKVLQSASFKKRVRRFHKQDKRTLDRQIRKILKDPTMGQEKRGDLKGVFVHKFKIHATQYLLSYRFVGGDLALIMIGPHENYYRDLSDYLGVR